MRKVLIVDDQPRVMHYYASALLADKDLRIDKVDHIRSSDAAYQYFSEMGTSDVVLIILDIMMDPGKAFRATAHQRGRRTGVFIFSHIANCARAQGRANPRKVPVAVLTNSADPETHAMLAVEAKKGARHVHFNTWHKPDYPALVFVDDLKKWLERIGRAGLR